MRERKEKREKRREREGGGDMGYPSIELRMKDIKKNTTETRTAV